MRRQLVAEWLAAAWPAIGGSRCGSASRGFAKPHGLARAMKAPNYIERKSSHFVSQRSRGVRARGIRLYGGCGEGSYQGTSSWWRASWRCRAEGRTQVRGGCSDGLAFLII